MKLTSKLTHKILKHVENKYILYLLKILKNYKYQIPKSYLRLKYGTSRGAWFGEEISPYRDIIITIQYILYIVTSNNDSAYMSQLIKKKKKHLR